MRPSRAPSPEAPEQEGFDMTPMIDCTFQLIIFFMITTDMSRVRTDPVELPAATRAALVRNADDLFLTLHPDGSIRVDGRSLGDAALEAFFERRRPRAESGMGYPVVLWADRNTPFEHVQKVLAMAGSRGTATRIQFAARMEER
jgi:biopolymer transport protein ExbD